MRKREVPQFIDIEDKIAFQLTAKQLGWAGLGGFFIFIAWVFLEQTYFIVVAVIASFLIIAILFVRPFGMSMPEFIKSMFFYLFKPKTYIWRRTGKVKKGNFRQENRQKEKSGNENNGQGGKKARDIKEIKKAAKALDIFNK
jgi:hypothetical protein